MSGEITQAQIDERVNRRAAIMKTCEPDYQARTVDGDTFYIGTLERRFGPGESLIEWTCGHHHESGYAAQACAERMAAQLS